MPFTKALDVIQQAQSGTGKTATFCAGILNNLDYNTVECQALVLAPTRELAQQIEKVMRALGDYLGVKCHACVGGTSVREDARILSAGVHVVVGTPGRVYDMLRRRWVARAAGPGLPAACMRGTHVSNGCWAGAPCMGRDAPARCTRHVQQRHSLLPPPQQHQGRAARSICSPQLPCRGVGAGHCFVAGSGASGQRA